MKRSGHVLFKVLLGAFIALISFSLTGFGQDAPEDTQEVAARFLDLLLKDPKPGTALNRTASFYRNTNRFSELEALCEQKRKDSPNDVRSWLLSGLIAYTSGHTDEAIDFLKKSLDFPKSNTESSLLLAQLLHAKGETNEACDILASLLKQTQTSAERLLLLQTLGQYYERLGRRNEAEKIWTEIEQTWPDNLEVRAQLAELLHEEGQYEQALRHYEYLAQKSGDAYARFQWQMAAARDKFLIGRKSEALAELSDTLDSLAPDSWLVGEVCKNVDDLFRLHPDTISQLQWYREAIEQHKGGLTLQCHFCKLLQQSGKLDESRTLLDKITAEFPEANEPRYLRISIALLENNYALATEQYEMLAEKNADDPDLIIQWGYTVFNNRSLPEESRRDEVKTIWSRLATGHESDPARLCMLADLFAKTEFVEDAERLYRRCIELEPDNPANYENLAHFYDQVHRPTDAVAMVNAMTQDERATKENLIRGSDTLLALGYTKEAEEFLHQAKAIAPDDFDVARRLTLVYLNQKDYSAAEDSCAELNRLAENEAGKQIAGELLLRLYRETHTGQEKLTALEKQLNDDTAAIWDVWLLLRLARELGSQEIQIRAMEKLIASSPNSIFFLTEAAQTCAAVGEQEKAIEFYEKLAILDSVHRLDHWRTLANLQCRSGNLSAALATAEKMTASAPSDLSTARLLADLLKQSGRIDDCIDVLRAAVYEHPEDDAVALAYATALVDSGQGDQADNFLRERLNGPAAQIMREIMVLHAYFKNPDMPAKRIQHAVDFLKSAQLDPESSLLLAKTLCQMNRISEAKEIFTKLTLQPIQGLTSYQILNQLKSSGSECRPLAIDYAKKIIRSLPRLDQANGSSDARVMENAIEFLQEQNELSEAAKELEDILKFGKPSITILQSLVASCLSSNQKEKAQELLHTYMPKIDVQPEQILIPATLYLDAELMEEASDFLKNAMKEQPEFVFACDYWNVHEVFQRCGMAADLLEHLKSLPDSLLARNIAQIGGCLHNYFLHKDTHDKAAEFRDYLWNLPDIKNGPTQRDIRIQLANSMEGLPPKDAKLFLQYIVTDAIKPGRSPSEYATPGGDIHIISSWCDTEAWSTSILLLDSMTEDSERTAFAAETKAIVKLWNELPEDQRDKIRYLDAIAMDLMLASERNDLERAKEMLELMAMWPAQDPQLLKVRTAIGLVLARSSSDELNTKALEILLKCKEQSDLQCTSVVNTVIAELLKKQKAPEK
ncbi:MAG: tetratricopeptide repeat protein [Planctomycetia bacterium]|nr:tetratricopeptide repeat protein [Planctomycetia bacterium]